MNFSVMVPWKHSAADPAAIICNVRTRMENPPDMETLDTKSRNLVREIRIFKHDSGLYETFFYRVNGLRLRAWGFRQNSYNLMGVYAFFLRPMPYALCLMPYAGKFFKNLLFLEK